jgi:hypothetical protein
MLRIEDINGWANLSALQREKSRRWIALNPEFLEGDEVLGFSTIGESVFLNHCDQFNYHQTRIT